MSRQQPLSAELNQELRAVLRRAMKTLGLSQGEAGAMLRVGQRTVSSFLAGRTGASEELAQRIAEVGGTSLDDLRARGAGRTDALAQSMRKQSATALTLNPYPGRRVRLDLHPRWPAAVDDARDVYRSIPPEAFAEIGSKDADAAIADALSAGLIADLATMLGYTTEEMIAADETAAYIGKTARADARRRARNAIAHAGLPAPLHSSVLPKIITDAVSEAFKESEEGIDADDLIALREALVASTPTMEWADRKDAVRAAILWLRAAASLRRAERRVTTGAVLSLVTKGAIDFADQVKNDVEDLKGAADGLREQILDTVREVSWSGDESDKDTGEELVEAIGEHVDVDSGLDDAFDAVRRRVGRFAPQPRRFLAQRDLGLPPIEPRVAKAPPGTQKNPDPNDAAEAFVRATDDRQPPEPEDPAQRTDVPGPDADDE